MRRLSGSVAFVLSLALAGAGCDKTPSTTTTPTTPTTPTTESFTGTIQVNGAVTFSFVATATGYIQATIKTLSPDTSAQLELALGTWNGTSCGLAVSNPSATQGITVTAYANSASALCVRMADAKAQLTQANTFEITVVHP